MTRQNNSRRYDRPSTAEDQILREAARIRSEWTSIDFDVRRVDDPTGSLLRSLRTMDVHQ